MHPEALFSSVSRIVLVMVFMAEFRLKKKIESIHTLLLSQSILLKGHGLTQFEEGCGSTQEIIDGSHCIYFPSILLQNDKNIFKKYFLNFITPFTIVEKVFLSLHGYNTRKVNIFHFTQFSKTFSEIF